MKSKPRLAAQVFVDCGEQRKYIYHGHRRGHARRQIRHIKTKPKPRSTFTIKQMFYLSLCIYAERKWVWWD